MTLATDLNEEQALFRDMVRDFAREEVGPIASQIDEEARFPAETLAKMGPLGLLGIPIPEEYEGAGADLLSYQIALEEIAYHCASTALSLAAHTSLCTLPILAFGNEDQKKRYVPDLASGRKLGAFGLTESQAGSDAGATRTRAVRDGKTWILNGSKAYITNASHAATFVVTARTSGRAGRLASAPSSSRAASRGSRWARRRTSSGTARPTRRRSSSRTAACPGRTSSARRGRASGTS